MANRFMYSQLNSVFNQPSGPQVRWLVNKHAVDELEDQPSFLGLYNGNACALRVKGQLNLATLFAVKPAPFANTPPESYVDVEKRAKIHTENELMLKLIHGTEYNFFALLVDF